MSYAFLSTLGNNTLGSLKPVYFFIENFAQVFWSVISTLVLMNKYERPNLILTAPTKFKNNLYEKKIFLEIAGLSNFLQIREFLREKSIR